MTHQLLATVKVSIMMERLLNSTHTKQTLVFSTSLLKEHNLTMGLSLKDNIEMLQVKQILSTTTLMVLT